MKNKISQKIFTAKTLSLYNGKNGQPAYVAVDGLVYDVSTAFVDGIHIDHQAGQDLSGEFHSMHAMDTLVRCPVMGTYSEK